MARDSFRARMAAGGAPEGRPGGTSRGATAGVNWRVGTVGVGIVAGVAVVLGIMVGGAGLGIGT